jgi:ribosomal protein S18 acetylase RimI-like enzyme
MSIDVRSATVADIDAIVDVAENAWYAAYGGVLDPTTIASAIEEYYGRELLEVAIERDEIAFYVAEDDDVVGFASAERTWADEVELHTIYVHPDRWGEGIGSMLLERVTAWANGEGVDRIACGVLAENVIGIGFFEACGFERGATMDAEIAGEIHTEYEFERPT